MTPTIIAAHSATDLLSALPHLCGYHPRESLVLIPFEHTTSVGLARLDLPPAEAIASCTATALGVLCQLSRVDGATVVIYTDDEVDPDAGWPHQDLVESIRERADHCGLAVHDALIVAANAWGRYPAHGGPGEVHPLSEIDPGSLELDGASEIASDQEDGLALPTVDPEQARRIGASRAALKRAEHPTKRGRSAPFWAVRFLSEQPRWPELFETALDTEPDLLDARTLALVRWVLDHPFARDVALTQWSDDLDSGREALEFNARWAGGDRSMDLSPMRLAGEGPRPDAERLERALALVRFVAGSTEPAHRAGPLAAAAWISWALGRSTHAGRYATDALAADPGNGLGRIVLSMVDSAFLPPWTYLRPERSVR